MTMNPSNSTRLALIGLAVATLFFSNHTTAAEDARYAIKYKHGQAKAAEKFVKRLQAKRMKRRGRESRRLFAAHLSRDQVARLRRSKLIESVELDPKRYLMAETVPYGVTMVQASPLLSDTAVPRKVCIIDTGYEESHEDLPGLASNRIDGHSQIPNETWYEDGNGHGTHVAGTVAALGGNNRGVIGVHSGQSLSLHIIKIFDNNGAWDRYASDLVDAVDRCVAAGSHVISMSLGGSFDSETERLALQDAANAGVVLVAAAGNSGNSSYSYPASYESVISVAAIDAGESIAYFSQTNDQVELAAPGVAVNSTARNNSYAAYNGTSMATPHVSAVAAVLWGLNPSCTAQQIRSHLGWSAKDLGSPGRDAQFGYGLVQLQSADNSIQQNGCDATPPPPPPKFELNNEQTVQNLAGSTGQAFEFQITLEPGATDLFVYIDGASGDADLYLRQGSAPTLNTWDCRPWSIGSNEQCSVSNPEPGIYHGMVYAYSSYSGVNLTATWNTPGEPPPNEPPIAIVSASTQDGPAPLTVQFDSSGSSDDNGISERLWDFGDDTRTSGPVGVSHTFESPGIYTTTLTVKDEQGESATAAVEIIVRENVAPVAQFNVSGQLQVGQNITFDASDSADPDGDIVDWIWQFGDGNSGSGQSVAHSYSAAATVDVSLTVLDNSGATHSTSQTLVITAAPEPPEASIDVTTSLNRKGTRMRVYWSGATTNRVEIYKNGVYTARTRNDGQWNDRNPTEGATYVVCNDRSTTDCSGPLP